jgi:malate synthase
MVVMRVKFVQSGGVIGAVRGCELESSALPPDDARELELLVQESGLSVSGEFVTAEARDLRRYAIEVERGAETVAVTFDDATLPERARPLVSYLRRNARPQPQR